jgi:hypothetical protein
MALADIEAELVGEVPARTCTVCHHMAERDPDWGERMRRMLANRLIKFSDIAQALSKDPDEPSIPEQTLSRHARGICAAGEVLR